MNVSIRDATSSDSAIILDFIRQLARYEHAEHEVVASVDSIAETLFENEGPAAALIAEADAAPVGFAVYFYTYSTWLAKPGLYIEDLYVIPEKRGHGVGKRLLEHLAERAVDRGCGRLEWSVLDWNEPAIGFYERIGATAEKEWVRYRLAGEPLTALARRNGKTHE